MADPVATAPMRFEGWELRPIERSVLVRGERATVGARAFDVLLALARAQGQIVTKGQLLDAAWPGLVVEENNISVQIAALRKVLGPEAISTVAGLGYRLSAVPLGRPPSGGVTARADDALPPQRGSAHLVGRDEDVDALVALVGTAPLVSLVGTGGVGKTSLARAVLARCGVRSEEEQYWIDLSPLRDGAQIAGLVAKALGVDLSGSKDAPEDLMSALAHTRMLVALDNCEHLLSSVAAFVQRAVQAAPAVRWLTTSQEPLHLALETVYRLEPLPVPQQEATLAEALAHGAVELFRQRAAAADRRFVLDEARLPLVISLCRQLDGLPLAIEIAAARVSTLGLEVVLEQLGRRLQLRTGSRELPLKHQTLHNTFDWSFGLLSGTEQKVFRRLAPFVGSFSADMAQRIAADPDDTPDALDPWQALEILGALVGKSLVQLRTGGAPRYQLLENAREYAAERLAEASEAAAWHRRHAHIVADWFDSARADLDQLNDAAWEARYVPEHHNVRAATAWACEAREPDVLARLVAAMGQIEALVRGQSELVQLPIPMDALDGAPTPLRAVACLELSWVHFLDGNRKTGTELSQRALEDFQSVGDVDGVYRALGQLIRLYESRPGTLHEAQRCVHLFKEVDDRAVSLRTRLFCSVAAGLQFQGGRTVPRLRELEQLAHQAGLDSLAAVCRVHITDELLIEQRFNEVVDAARQFLAAGEAMPRMRAFTLINEVLALVRLGRIDEAQASARAALRILPRASHLIVGPFVLAAAREERFVDAALMAGYCVQVRRERDERADPAEAAAAEEAMQILQRSLGPARLDEIMRVGSLMHAGDVVATALPMLALPKVARPAAKQDRSP